VCRHQVHEPRHSTRVNEVRDCLDVTRAMRAAALSPCAASEEPRSRLEARAGARTYPDLLHGQLLMRAPDQELQWDEQHVRNNPVVSTLFYVFKKKKSRHAHATTRENLRRERGRW